MFHAKHATHAAHGTDSTAPPRPRFRTSLATGFTGLLVARAHRDRLFYRMLKASHGRGTGSSAHSAPRAGRPAAGRPAG